MSHGGKRTNAGRKPKMEAMNYWGWVQDVIVAYLNQSDQQVIIEKPVQVFIRKNGILVSLLSVRTTFGEEGRDHFKRWFNVKEEGNQFKGNSIVAITTDNEIRTEIYKWLVETGSLDLINEDCGFIKYEHMKESGELDIMLSKYKLTNKSAKQKKISNSSTDFIQEI